MPTMSRMRTMERQRASRRKRTTGAMGIAVALLQIAGWMTSAPASAVATSCDVTTGASCLWGRGCDCDHDGYVRSSGKSKKYCHFTKCPLDKNDNDPNQLGKISTYNADGDGWTKQYDCDDKDPCSGKTCGVSTCKVVVDKDKDGVPADKDCNDADPNVKPGASIACCNCDIIGDPVKKKAFGCTSGCPLSAPPKDAGMTSPDAAASDTSTVDTGAADTATSNTGNNDTMGATTQAKDTVATSDSAVPKIDSSSGKLDSSASQPDSRENSSDAEQPNGATRIDGLAWDSGLLNRAALVGGGQLNRKEPPAPGCSATPNTGGAGPLNGWVLLLLVPLAFGWFARRQHSQRRSA